MSSDKEAVAVTREDDHQMSQLRQLVLGKDNQLVRDTVEKDARGLVGQVLTEALHDRQKLDGSVSEVLTPLVEKSVESSVVARKEQFVGYLYPLVGSLVRKSVSAFLSDVLEQTNELLESSLTYKGLKWRFKAWQAGVSYTQYVVSQTFVFRVEQVLLIHRETGMLLKTVIRDKTQATDGDMVSAMLTAINDFVSDSFAQDNQANEQHLDEIKTDDFTLLIKQGPKAILVAAVTGKVPAKLGEKLQLTLENIHRVYHNELNSYDGDSLEFDNTEQQLNECLIEQQKEEEQQRQNKRPWLALSLVVLTLGGMSYYISRQWQIENLIDRIQQLPPAPGLVLLSTHRCNEKICIELLRDPEAKTVGQWLKQGKLESSRISVIERPYRSLDNELFKQRLIKLAAEFPELVFQAKQSQFSGQLSPERFRQFKQRISALPENVSPTLTDHVTVSTPSVSQQELNELLLDREIDKIEQSSIYFDLDQSGLTDSAHQAVNTLSQDIDRAVSLATQLKQNLQIIVMGTSDSVGSTTYNRQLSARRAEAVRTQLVKLGVNPEMLRTTGLGVLESDHSSRRVIFGVIRLPPEQTKKEQE